MHTNSRRRLFAALLAGLVVLWPAILWAHARLTGSEPRAKAQLAVVPSVIRLWFSEPPELALTTITLKDSSGTAVALGPVAPDSSRLGVRASITSRLTPGRYTVVWRVVAGDGHPVSGSYSFVVLASAVAQPDTATSADTMRSGGTTGSDVEPQSSSAESVAYVA